MLREFALKPGIILGSVSFLSPSLATRAASLALSITSGFVKSTGGASGGGAALAWEAMGLAASSWLSLVRRAARSAACCAMIWASGIGAALLVGGGRWALLDTDEEVAAVLLDDGVVREEGGSAGGVTISSSYAYHNRTYPTFSL